MAVNDAVGLVGAGRGLVHALRENRNDTLGAREQIEKILESVRAIRAKAGHGGELAGGVFGDRERAGGTARMRATNSLILEAVLVQVGKQAIEKPDIGARLDRQMQIGDSQVGVRRGSMTTTLSSGRLLLASTMR